MILPIYADVILKSSILSEVNLYSVFLQLTYCQDGNVRAMHLYPHRFLVVVGHHEGELPIEKMDVSGSGEVIASIG